MIGYYTDNQISQGVMQAFQDIGIPIRHISKFSNFSHTNQETPIFYGMLRGTGMAVRWCQAQGYPFYYLDNGYFDAVYMDQNKVKEMTGKLRVVKNDLIERYPHKPHMEQRSPMRILILPPTPYSAFMHDTTPEDWMQYAKALVSKCGDHATIRTKDNNDPFAVSIQGYDAILAFNSMGVIEASKYGLAVYDTHGVFRNIDMYDTAAPYYDYDELIGYYSDKQFTLDEIREGKCTMFS